MYESNYLKHYGILGMKWGVRRYQNKDGTYTAAGKARRNDSDAGKTTSVKKKTSSSEKAVERAKQKTAILEEKAKQAEMRSRVRAAKEAERREAYQSRIKAAEAKKVENLAAQKVSEVSEKKVSAGQNYVSGIMGDVGKKVLVTALSGAALYALSQAASHKMDGGLKGQTKNAEFWQGLGTAMFNGGPKKK